MPIYTHKCKNNHITEQLISRTDFKQDIPCGECGEKATRVFHRQSVKGIVSGGTGGGRKRIRS